MGSTSLVGMASPTKLVEEHVDLLQIRSSNFKYTYLAGAGGVGGETRAGNWGYIKQVWASILSRNRHQQKMKNRLKLGSYHKEDTKKGRY